MSKMSKPFPASKQLRSDSRGLRKVGSFLLLLHQDSASRYWEVDALRGVAIVMMIVYHLAYDLAWLGYYQADVRVGPWWVFARVIAILFLLLLGASLALSHARICHRARGWDLFRYFLVRGLKLVGWGMVVTLVTWIYMDKVVVMFGILHLMGVATILASPFLQFRWVHLVLGSGIIAADVYLNRFPLSFPRHSSLFALGLRPLTSYQIDYFPLLPWFGVVLLGIFVGQVLFPNGRQRFRPPNLRRRAGIKQLVWLGRHSLLVYLIHQPVLIAILTLASAIASDISRRGTLVLLM